ncbi:MAG: NADH-quinone oxidoreductase subunit NuoE [Alphaproteobacteria bacterium]|nr:NADH-quinone oxidoreductase subunit NuoE [Alphaproteobacteria bacterium]
MSAASHGPAPEQPASFDFTAENMERAKRIIAKYPQGRQQSAVIPLLDLAQRQHGWVTNAIIEKVAQILELAPIRVREVATFYTMFNMRPVGRHHVQICTTTPCWLRGSDDIVAACSKALGIGLGETTADGQFTLGEVECLGACVNAPMMQIGDAYYEDLDAASTVRILDDLKAGRKPKPGPQVARQTSAPISGLTTLKGNGSS